MHERHVDILVANLNLENIILDKPCLLDEVAAYCLV